MMNFGILTAEICWRVWGTPANFNRFRVLAALLHGTLVEGVMFILRNNQLTLLNLYMSLNQHDYSVQLTDLLDQPRTNTAIASRAFSVAAPKFGTVFLLVLLPVIITVHLKANLKLTCLPPS